MKFADVRFSGDTGPPARLAVDAAGAAAVDDDVASAPAEDEAAFTADVVGFFFFGVV